MVFLVDAGFCVSLAFFYLRSGESWSVRCRDARLVGGVLGDGFVILFFIDYIYGIIGAIMFCILLLGGDVFVCVVLY